MKGKNVLTVSSQVVPYLEESSISKMSYQIPKMISDFGGKIRVFMPRFGVINERKHQLHEVIRLSGVNLVIDDTDMPLIIKVASIPKERIQVYFIDNDDYFKRKSILEDSKGVFFNDNDERTMFFVKGVLETIKKLNWEPDIIHLHGWMSMLLPLYVRKYYKKETLFQNSKIITSIYDDEFEGNLGDKMFDKLKQDGFENEDIDTFKDSSYETFVKVAVNHSDALILASDKINKKLEEYIYKSSTPLLSYSSEKMLDNHYIDFFRKLLSAN